MWRGWEVVVGISNLFQHMLMEKWSKQVCLIQPVKLMKHLSEIHHCINVWSNTT